MITKKKSVYYCEHCKKYRLTKYSMQLHESKCLRNPNRVCRAAYCPGATPDYSMIESLIENATATDIDGEHRFVKKEDIAEVLKELECPVCTLSVLVQASVKVKAEDDFESLGWNWDFKPIHNEYYNDWLEECKGYRL